MGLLLMWGCGSEWELHSLYMSCPENKPLTDGITNNRGLPCRAEEFQIKSRNTFQNIIDQIGGFPQDEVKDNQRWSMMSEAV